MTDVENFLRAARHIRDQRIRMRRSSSRQAHSCALREPRTRTWTSSSSIASCRRHPASPFDAIPRALTHADPALAVRYARSFDDLFTGADVRGVIALTEELLAAQRGLLFDGYRSEAPATWRQARPWVDDPRANATGACHIRDYRDDDREAIRACLVGLQEFERRIAGRARDARSSPPPNATPVRRARRNCASACSAKNAAALTFKSDRAEKLCLAGP